MGRKSNALRALNKAIEAGGGMFALARSLKITPDAVQKWRRRGLPLGRALQLENLTGIPAKALRPDLFL